MSEFHRIERGFLNLRGKPGNSRFVSSVAQVTGFELPDKANIFTAGDDSARAYWLGPDEWLIATARERMASLVEDLEAALAGYATAINDVSGGLVLLELAGAHGRELLAHGCPLDLHAEKFRSGDCAQTTLAKTNVVIACIDDAPVCEIIVRRSFSEYLLRWLTRLSLAGSASSS